MVKFWVRVYRLSHDDPGVCLALEELRSENRQLKRFFAQELERLEPEMQNEIALYTLTQIQPRVVLFKEKSTLLGLPCPVNSVGNLPLGYMKLKEESEYKNH